MLAATGSQQLGFVVGCLPLIDAISAFAVCALLCSNYVLDVLNTPANTAVWGLDPGLLCTLSIMGCMYSVSLCTRANRLSCTLFEVQAIGVQQAAFCCNLGTALEVATLLVVIGLGALCGKAPESIDANPDQDWPPFTSFITATVLCVFAYGGLPQGLDFASEMEDPRRSVARYI